jgi:hypothetical protein
VPPVILAPDKSAELRARLLGEFLAISSSEQATDWARNFLPVKNTLTVADAQAIEQAFERRLTELSETAVADAELPWVREQGDGESPGQSETRNEAGDQSQAGQSPEIAAEQANSAVDPGTTAAPHGPPYGIDKPSPLVRSFLENHGSYAGESVPMVSVPGLVTASAAQAAGSAAADSEVDSDGPVDSLGSSAPLAVLLSTGAQPSARKRTKQMDGAIPRASRRRRIRMRAS